MAVAFWWPMGTGAVLVDSSPKLEFPDDSALCGATAAAVATVSTVLLSSSADGRGSWFTDLVAAEKTLFGVPVEEREEKVWLLVLQCDRDNNYYTEHTCTSSFYTKDLAKLYVSLDTIYIYHTS